MAKKSFILYHDQKEVIDELDDEQAGKLIKAIYEYNVNKKITLTGALKLVFIPFKTAFDRNNDKWDDTAEKRSEAGKRHTGNQYTRRKQKEMEQMEQVSQNGTNGTVSVSVSGSVSDNVSVSESVNNITHPTTPTEIFNYCFILFDEYSKDDLEKSCIKMFRHYETKKWNGIYNWKMRAEEWIEEDIDKGKIKRDKSKKKVEIIDGIRYEDGRRIL